MRARAGAARQKPLLLWCDFSFTPQDREPRVAAARHFRVAYTNRPDRVLEDVARFEPAALCFDLDHVDAARVVALDRVIAANPRLPTLMLTVEHSEALAVWAFRAGVWNLLVKPVPAGDMAANLQGLLGAAVRRVPVRSPRPPGVGSPPIPPASAEDRRVERLEPALQYVRRHYGEKLTETEAARRCGMKRFAFSHAFHAAYGLTFRDYVMNTRIGEAQRLLREGGRTITEVAFATGFTDASYFARTFRQRTGVLPSRFREADPLPGPASFPAP